MGTGFVVAGRLADSAKLVMSAFRQKMSNNRSLVITFGQIQHGPITSDLVVGRSLVLIQQRQVTGLIEA
jgi:hypothetical protein